jgi:hypothetical protein
MCCVELQIGSLHLYDVPSTGDVSSSFNCAKRARFATRWSGESSNNSSSSWFPTCSPSIAAASNVAEVPYHLSWVGLSRPTACHGAESAFFYPAGARRLAMPPAMIPHLLARRLQHAQPAYATQPHSNPWSDCRGDNLGVSRCRQRAPALPHRPHPSRPSPGQAAVTRPHVALRADASATRFGHPGTRWHRGAYMDSPG